jgi:hypothetical protein
VIQNKRHFCFCFLTLVAFAIRATKLCEHIVPYSVPQSIWKGRKMVRLLQKCVLQNQNLLQFGVKVWVLRMYKLFLSILPAFEVCNTFSCLRTEEQFILTNCCYIKTIRQLVVSVSTKWKLFSNGYLRSLYSFDFWQVDHYTCTWKINFFTTVVSHFTTIFNVVV